MSARSCSPFGRPAAKCWHWAVHELLRHIPHYAKLRHSCDTRPPEIIKLFASNLDPLSSLAGFNPANPPDTWNAKPTHTLRFAEVLAKIYASLRRRRTSLFDATPDHLNGDDPFPLQAENDALDMPLGLPGDDYRHSQWALRDKLLRAEINQEEEQEWSWSRIEAVLRHEFGYTSVPGNDPLLSIGQHFFPGILEAHGYSSSTIERQYRVPLPGANATMCGIRLPTGRFGYDTGASMVWTQLSRCAITQ